MAQRGDSPLMKAASEDRTEVVSLLLKVGANIDLQNEVRECVTYKVIPPPLTYKCTV